MLDFLNWSILLKPGNDFKYTDKKLAKGRCDLLKFSKGRCSQTF